MKPSYAIPAVYVGREEQVELNSNDLVLPWPGITTRSDEVYEVEQDREGFYEVSILSSFSRRRRVLFKARKVRLAKVVGSFLIEQHLTGPVPCFPYKGVWHRYLADQYGGIGSVCGEHLYRNSEMTVMDPTCQECREPFWAVMNVLPHRTRSSPARRPTRSVRSSVSGNVARPSGTGSTLRTNLPRKPPRMTLLAVSMTRSTRTSKILRKAVR